MAKADIRAKEWGWYTRGDFYYDRSRYGEAIECYDKVTEINPNLVEAWKKKGNAFCLLEKYEEGIKCYDQVLKISKNDDPQILCSKLDAIIGLGRLNERYEKNYEALECYDKVLELHPNDFKACIGKASALYALKKYEESLVWYNKVQEVTNNIQVWNRKGNILYALKKYEESQQCYSKVKELNPNDYDNAVIWCERGNTFYESKRYEQAIQCYDKIIQQQICRKDHAIGNYISWLGYNEAIKCYDKAIEENLSNNNTDLLYKEVLFLSYKKLLFLSLRDCTSGDEYIHRKVETLKCYDKIIEINPNDAEAWINKGLIHEILQSYVNPIKCYDKAIEVNSNYENNTYVWLYLCYALAYKLFRYGQPVSSGFRHGCQWIKIEGALLRRDVNERRERLEKALDCINKALECNSKHANIWETKGEILLSLKRYDDAIKCRDKVLEIDPTRRYVC